MSPFDATRRIQGLERSRRSTEEYWLHVEADSPLEKYPAKHHARRVRDRLDVAEGLIYLPGAPARNNEDSDMPAPFRQRRYFYYLSGCNETDCHLTYDIQHDILALFIPRINPGRVIWNGRGSTPAEAMDKYDIDEVHYVDELPKELIEWQFRYTGKLYVLHPNQAPKKPFMHTDPDTTSLQPAMNLCRMIKDDHEIDLIRKANVISSEAHKKVLASITKFKNEAQVEGLFMDVCISKQAKQQAYDPIAASGPNAGTLHYDANDEDFEDRQLMCLDAGCEFENYASDITRTFPLSGAWPSKESENIYKLVERMQETCIERLAPGVRYLDLHILAHQIAIDGLLQVGILHNGTKEEIFKAGTSKAFFPHGLGHHIGLEVHDVGQRELMSFYEKNPQLEKAPSLYPEDFHLSVYDEDMCLAPTDPQSPHLEEGMVVTVEPGIYFSRYALTHFYLPSPVHSKYINAEVVKKYLPVGGVRIEDDLLITSKGYENLTTAPKGEAMLEVIRKQNAKLPSVSPTSMSPKMTEDQPILRAPGIPKRMSDPIIKSVSRASTVPVARTRDRKSVDFEPYDGPSLFSGFGQPAIIKTEPNAANPPQEKAEYKLVTGGKAGDLLKSRPDSRPIVPSQRPMLVPQHYSRPEDPEAFTLRSQQKLEQDIRRKASTAAMRMSTADRLQRRSVTFGSYPQPPSPPQHNTVATSPPSNPYSHTARPHEHTNSTTFADSIHHAALSQQYSEARDLSAGFARERVSCSPPSLRLTSHPSMPTLRTTQPPHEQQPRHHTVPPPQRLLSSYPGAATSAPTNPWRDAAAAAITAPLSTYENSVRLLRDQKMEELRRAMETVWRIKDDVEKTFGEALAGASASAGPRSPPGAASRN